jgi:hypothetical protein
MIGWLTNSNIGSGRDYEQAGGRGKGRIILAKANVKD